MHFNTPYVHYLEVHDFDANTGRLLPQRNPITKKQVFQGRTIVMVQGNYCGFCTQFKPLYTAIATKFNSSLDFATIQIDSSESPFTQQQLVKVLKRPVAGVPMFVKFDNGYPVDVYSGGRDEAAFTQWVMQ